MQIEVWSDIACPWCWIGKQNLDLALAGIDDVEVIWRAFELNPQAGATPADPVDYVERLATKYGMSRADAQGFIDRMTAAGRERDVEIRFDRIRPANTFDAHRLLSWARAFGRQNELKERLFLAYMNESADLADASTLAALATEVGLDANAADELLATGAHAEEARADKQRATELRVTGVPFFSFGKGVTASGAQPPEAIRQAMEHARKLSG